MMIPYEKEGKTKKRVPWAMKVYVHLVIENSFVLYENEEVKVVVLYRRRRGRSGWLVVSSRPLFYFESIDWKRQNGGGVALSKRYITKKGKVEKYLHNYTGSHFE